MSQPAETTTDKSLDFMLGAERWGGGRRPARPAHIFRVKGDSKYSLCGRIHEAYVWNWFPGSSIQDADCARCLERWRAEGKGNEPVGERL